VKNFVRGAFYKDMKWLLMND